MSCDWEGNRRSGVALAVHHRLKWFIHLRAHGLSKGDEHSTNTHHGYGTLYLFISLNCTISTQTNIDKSSAVAEMGDRARAKWVEKWGVLILFPWGNWVPI